MLRFNGKTPAGRKSPRNYSSRREQYRLMVMVFALGFVILMAVRAADPANWQWLAGAIGQGATAEGGGAATQPPPTPVPANVDTRHHPTLVAPLPLGTVRVAAEADERPDNDGNYYPGVVSMYLREVRDNQPFRPLEASAWFNLLGVLDRADDATLQNAADGSVNFVQLFQQPEAYRGRLVRFQGRIRRIRSVDAGRNTDGIEHYYELILKPQAGPPRPTFAYVLNLPEALQAKFKANPGGEMDEPIVLTGFFFKNWVYAGEHATYVAPVMLARNVDWRPSVPEPVYVPSMGAIAVLVAGSALAAALIAGYAYRLSRRRMGVSAPPAETAEVQASLAMMAQFDAPSEQQPNVPPTDPWQSH